MEPKTLKRHRQRAEAVADAVDEWSDLIAQRLAMLRKQVRLEREAPSSAQTEEFLGFFAELLKSQTANLEESAEALRNKLSRLRRLRSVRDEAAAEVYELVVRLRRSVQAAGGRTAEEKLFGTGKTAREAEPLARQARDLLTHLQPRAARELLLDDPEQRAFVHRQGQALEEPVKRLEASLVHLVVHQSAEAVARRSLKRKRAEVRRSLSGAFQMLEGLLKIAGREEAVANLRPKPGKALKR